MTRPPRPATVTRRHADQARRTIIGAFVGVTALVGVTYIAFFGLPTTGGFDLKGTFASTNQLRTGSEVRQAGVRIGTVTAIWRGPDDTSVVTMHFDNQRTIRSDTRLAIRSRLLLEGNAVIDVLPGASTAAPLKAGATIPESQTSVPVQLDQVLDTFDVATRRSLHASTNELRAGLSAGPGGGAENFRRSSRALERSIDDIARVATAARGTTAGDLGRAIRSFDAFAGELASDPRALAELETSTARLTAALTVGDRRLGESVRELDLTLRTAPPALDALDRALPSVTRLSYALRPALRAAPQPLRRITRLVRSIDHLVRPAELPELLERLDPLLDRAPTVLDQLTATMPHLDKINRCLSRNVVPALKQVVPDGPNTTGDPAWLDLLHATANLAGASTGFDGNGTAIRLGVSQGSQAINGVLPGLGRVVGGGPQIEGVRPTWLGYGVEPPFRPDALCTQQPLPDFGARADGPPPAWAMPAKGGGR